MRIQSLPVRYRLSGNFLSSAMPVSLSHRVKPWNPVFQGHHGVQWTPNNLYPNLLNIDAILRSINMLMKCIFLLFLIDQNYKYKI